MNNLRAGVQVFDNQIFTIIVISTAIMASTVKPIMIVARMFNKPVKQFNYEGKTTEEIKSTFAEFRILACIPFTRYLAGIIKLLSLASSSFLSCQIPPCNFLSASSQPTSSSSLKGAPRRCWFLTMHLIRTYRMTHQKAESNPITNILEKCKLRAGEMWASNHCKSRPHIAQCMRMYVCWWK